jgi:site-specific DNA-methyltransferase (adenine-specific)
MSFKVIQGDCLEVMRTMPDKSVDLVLTDPPYGLTDCAWDNSLDWDKVWKELNRIGKDECNYVVFGKQPFLCGLILTNIKNYKYELIWEKEKGVNYISAKYKPMISHENIIVFYKRSGVYNPQYEYGKPYTKNNGDKVTAGETHSWVPRPKNKINDGRRYPKSVLKFSRDMNRCKSKNHPTQKPLALMKWLVCTYSTDGDCILDICCGSGTTGVAALKLGRNFIGIEIDPKYCTMAEKRIRSECGLLIGANQ